LTKKVRRTIDDAQRPHQPLMHLIVEILRICPKPTNSILRGELK
jgi:hypothetical protein